ncbi:MAG TPA: thiamine pyrophosphate-requiring protein [Methylomirabilota bacterium]|nr:thiamine pyrophosphate-requiring protein [Methylomirabilota bacterium]
MDSRRRYPRSHARPRRQTVKVVDAVARILKIEGAEFLSAYPTTPVIEAAARAEIRPVLCRQERVGVGIADGYARVTNGRKLAAFCMQYGPGAENAFPGVATAYSDSTPMLLLPLGHQRDRAQVFPLFSSARTFASVTKGVETITQGGHVADVMRRAISLMRMGRPGPTMVEIPADVVNEEVSDALVEAYRPVKATTAGANVREVEAAARVLREARRPVIHAGQGVLYAEASEELLELAELLQAPVMTTLEGKSAFPEDHPLALGAGGPSVTGPTLHYLREADVVLGVGCSFTRHGMAAAIPAGKTIIHATNDERDLNKSYLADHPLLGDARLVLRQFVEAVKSQGGRPPGREHVRAELERVRAAWLAEWAPILGSAEVPMTPYRVMAEFMRAVDPREAIVTHDSGSPRDQLLPFYRSVSPRGYLGWGKSHALGTGLGLTIGAKLAAPDKLCVNFMGDAAFGMTGLDFETAVRCGVPILTVVLNNSAMAIEIPHLVVSHDKYGTRDIGGRYADLGRAMGGWSERVERPEDIAGAFARARKATEGGQAALLEFITSQETRFSHRGALR